MARKLVISALIALPADEFDAADVVSKVRDGIAGASKAIGDALGDPSFAFDVKFEAARKHKAKTPPTA